MVQRAYADGTIVNLKSRLLRAATHPLLDPLVRSLRHGRATILMLHRFDAGEASGALAIATLRAQLGYLRDRGYAFVPLLALVEDITSGRPPPRDAIAFTVDDGYADFRDLAVPVFAEFECPVTVFVTTGPVDRSTWFWWDRIEHAFDNTTARSVDIAVGSDVLHYRWTSHREARAASSALAEALKSVPDAERLDAIERLCAQLDVDASGPVPARYETMTWDDLRRLTDTGAVSVAPHTVTHPILSRLDSDRLSWEIVESWRRVRQECPAAIPVFCYPNGTPADYSAATIDIVRRAGFMAAVTTEEGHVGALGSDADDRYRLPRFACPDDVPHLAQVVNGMEAAKLALRGLRAG